MSDAPSVRPTLTRAQRGPLREYVVLEVAAAAAALVDGLDPKDARPHDAQDARHRLRELAALLDDLGWDADDQRDEFELTLEPERLQGLMKPLFESAKRAFFFISIGTTDEFEDDAGKAEDVALTAWRVLAALPIDRRPAHEVATADSGS